MANTGVFGRLPLSPDSGFRRTSLNRQSLSIHNNDRESLSSSLPLALTKKEVEHLREMEKVGKSPKWKESYEEQQERLATQRSPTLSPSKLGAFRPRSASLFTFSPPQSGTLKRSLLGLSRGHPSAKHVQQKSMKQSSQEVPGPSPEVNTHKVDTAFAQIKQQLEQLSDENLVIEERINRLMNGITQLMKTVNFQSCYSKGCGTQSYRNGQLKLHGGNQRMSDRNFTPSAVLKSPAKHRMLTISRTMSDQTCCHPSKILLSDVQEIWEEQSIGKSIEKVDGLPFAPPSKEQHHFPESEKSVTRRFSGDSSGSAVSGPSSTSSTCVVIVTEVCGQDELQPLPTQPSGSTRTEDDVFLSQ